MQQLLITIRPDVLGKEFLARLKDVVLEEDTFEVVADGGRDLMPEDRKLALAPKRYQCHRHLELILIAPGERPHIVELNLVADHWNPDLTYSIYTSAARDLMNPVLQGYNRRFKRRVRLGIPGPPKPKRLPPGAQQMFGQYINLANKGCAHSQDWDNFYRFTIYCHDYHVSLESEELRELLLRGGFDEEAARELACVYQHGRKILRLQGRARADRLWARDHR